MTKYLIEVPHDADPAACDAAIEIFLTSGSHFMTNADWGCKDGIHKAWMIVDVDSKSEAQEILPPAFRAQSKITSLIKFELDSMGEIRPLHE
jgi:hypothetical protein